MQSHGNTALYCKNVNATAEAKPDLIQVEKEFDTECINWVLPKMYTDKL